MISSLASLTNKVIFAGLLSLAVFQMAKAAPADPLLDDSLYFEDGVTVTTVGGTSLYSNGLVASERDGDTVVFSFPSSPGEENDLRDIAVRNAARREIELPSELSPADCTSIGGKDFKDYCN